MSLDVFFFPRDLFAEILRNLAKRVHQDSLLAGQTLCIFACVFCSACALFLGVRRGLLSEYCRSWPQHCSAPSHRKALSLAKHLNKTLDEKIETQVIFLFPAEKALCWLTTAWLTLSMHFPGFALATSILIGCLVHADRSLPYAATLAPQVRVCPGSSSCFPIKDLSYS
jgi:hypothetical protein